MHYKEQDHLISIYQDRIDHFNSELEANQALSTRYSYTRLVIFILSIPVIYFLTILGSFAVIGGVLLSIILFVYAVIKQQKYDKLVQEFKNLILINDNEISAITAFRNDYHDGEQFEQAHHFYTDDLDIFGPNSLYALINRAKTFNGVQYLHRVFLELPTFTTLLKRQDAIKELQEKLEWRQDFANSLYDIEGGYSRDLASEIDQELQVDLRFAQGAFLSIYQRVLPFVWLGVIILFFVNFDIAKSLAAVLFFGNLVLTLRKARETSDVQNHLSKASIMLRSYRDSLEVIFNEKWNSEMLASEVRTFKSISEKTSSVQILKELQQIIEHLDWRLNLIPAILLNGFILWDYNVLNRLFKWKTKNEGKLDALFEFIGKMEGLSSLATWAYNHPHYSYPTINDEYLQLNATDIKHPLIPASENVGNDFSIEKGEHLNIVTGSNMSGKSTLLRTIGINMILGYTGTKVAADQLAFPIVKVISYMRIKDILEESVSTFKAELNRIQMILDILKTDSQCFILIDEMLRGTNSKDKLTGSIGIAKRLLAENTYAMIATHDIKLAELGNEFESGIANYYFDIDYAEGDLVFDYKVKEGICENFNASFLLGQLGIEM